MTAEITTSDSFVLARALNKLEKITRTRYLWAMQHVAYANQHRTDPPFSLPRCNRDLAKYHQLLAKLVIFIVAQDAGEQSEEDLIPGILDLSGEDVIRAPRSGEVEETIKEIENLFAYVTSPPPRRPGGGGRRIRKAA
jgi:hypothetical protein